MFWVIFDTSTKRDYYRDVHNLLALPRGSILRYDYGEKNFSASAIEEANKGSGALKQVLLAYAQTKTFKKGDGDPQGTIEYAQSIWIATRLAALRHIHHSVKRYYLDLELLGYPAPDDVALGNIIQPLLASNEVPFSKWIAISDRDEEYRSLSAGNESENWTAVVNKIGAFPSQFAGDTFWRVMKVARGTEKRQVAPVIENLSQTVGTEEIVTGVQAVYPIKELTLIGVEIESRMPEGGEESRGKEPELRHIDFESNSLGPLAGFNGKALSVRRYQNYWTDGEVAGTDRIDDQTCELKMTTSPAGDGYATGPQISLRFRASKEGWKAYMSLMCGIISVVMLVTGGVILKDYFAGGVILLVSGALLGVVAYFLWTGRIKLPGGK